MARRPKTVVMRVRPPAPTTIHVPQPCVATQRLQDLVGLQTVKEAVAEIVALGRINRRRQTAGLRVSAQALHMVFRGNPGTGKTTVARLLGEILHEQGVLSRGHLVEAERADLVGEYIGHTAHRTRALLQRALGGILFVDEAYSLARGGERDFGREAIDTLVKAIEDHHEDLLLILAGYTAEMNLFLQSNPGLVSRLPIVLDFPDYRECELLEIAEHILREREYALRPEARQRLVGAIYTLVESGASRAGNARLVRNLLEAAIRRQARRLARGSAQGRGELYHIEADDMPPPAVSAPGMGAQWQRVAYGMQDGSGIFG